MIYVLHPIGGPEEMFCRADIVAIEETVLEQIEKDKSQQVAMDCACAPYLTCTLVACLPDTPAHTLFVGVENFVSVEGGDKLVFFRTQMPINTLISYLFHKL